MTEAAIIAWFTAHQFTHAMAVAVVGAVSASVRSDRAALATERETDPTAEFRWNVALKHYAKGAVAAAGAVLGAKILHVLGMV